MRSDVMGRWIALGITLACFGSCSFMSQSVFRGMVAPVGVIVFGFITLLLFVQARVSQSARPAGAALLDAETQVLLRQRASRLAERNSPGVESRAGADATPGPSGSTH
jgi:hypothetical protein